MKSFILISFVTSISTIHLWAESKDNRPMRDTITREELAIKSRQASLENPMRKLSLAKGPDPSLVNQPKDLISESDVICFNGAVTLVPKRAILQIPKNLEDRFKYQKGAKLMSWADFYALNRGWITTVEVSRIQAEGNSPIPEETQQQMVKSGNLIVATYQSGPISVLPLKVSPEKTTQNPKL
jgi:hypothetical protein